MSVKLLLVMVFAAALGARAQSTNSAPLDATQPSVQRPVQAVPRTLPKPTRPNQAVLGKTLVSGAAVQAAKSRNPLQLINPLAPASYGAAKDNVAWNPIDSAPAGVKVFAIHF